MGKFLNIFVSIEILKWFQTRITLLFFLYKSII